MAQADSTSASSVAQGSAVADYAPGDQPVAQMRERLTRELSHSGKEFCRAYTAGLDAYLEKLFNEAVTELASNKFGGKEALVSADVALVALGGYGRGEMSPQSDLDIQLIYGNDYRTDVNDFAKMLWYPLWNDKIKLGHSVGSFSDIALLARHELNTASTLLSARHIAGDSKVTDRLYAKALKIWYSQGGQWIEELLEDAGKRHDQFGSAAYLLEPNLKQGAGGLRDTHLLCWGMSALRKEPPFGGMGVATESGGLDFSVSAGILSDDSEICEAYEVLLSNRILLHSVSERPDDLMLFQYQDQVAELGGYRDARDLMSSISLAARLISWRFSEMLPHFQALSNKSDMLAKLRPRGRKSDSGLPTSQDRNWQSLAGYAVADTTFDGSVPVEFDSSFADIELAQVESVGWGDEKFEYMVRVNPEAVVDEFTVLKLGVAAAELRAYLSRESLKLLSEKALPLPAPWPKQARDLFVRLLSSGHSAVRVIESLDIANLFVHFIPEWEECRCLPQQNVYHRFTVDRHLSEAAAEASKLQDRVTRPDLLVVGALLHDIGKGYPGDHTTVGIPMVGQIAKRMGYPSEDIAVLQQMVRHHLLLPDIATKRDISDVTIIQEVAEKLETVDNLLLLGALTEADSIATSKHAWSSWKKGLLGDLVTRTEKYMREGNTEDLEDSSVPTSQHRSLMAAGESLMQSGERKITVISQDHVGQFGEVVGVLTLNGLYVREGTGYVQDGMALCHFVIEPTFEGEIDWERIESQIAASLQGHLALEARLSQRSVPQILPADAPPVAIQKGTTQKSTPQESTPQESTPQEGTAQGDSPGSTSYIKFDGEASAQETVIEIGASDQFSLLRHLLVAMVQMRLDIKKVNIESIGGSVVASFHVCGGDGQPIHDGAQKSEVERAIAHAIVLSESQR